MIYTVGQEVAYDANLIKYGGDLMKVGMRHNYPGGFACRTVDDACRLIEEFGKVGIWAVYEVDAEWEKDTRPSTNGWWHALLYDSRILRKMG